MVQTVLIASRYKILDTLGSGGMGTVYRARDIQQGKTIALKQLKADVAQIDEMLERFKREGEALRQLNHPNIVKMLDTVQQGDDHYLVLEYVEGGDLWHLMEKQQLPIERIINIALDLTDALTRAHRLNIIHRDIKPANVLIAKDGTPRLTDFGVALMKSEEPVTETGAPVGTLDYLPPEALQSRTLTAQADIWSFGVLLYEMLIQQRPFKRSSLAEVVYAILGDPVPDIEALRPDTPRALIDLIYRMLEKDPLARISTIRQVGLELEALLENRGVTPPPSQIRFDATITFWAHPRHNLPLQVTSFIGRYTELLELNRLLLDPDHRLITILGPGGMGKTRIALELAHMYMGVDVDIPPTPIQFFHGIYFAELAPLSDPKDIIAELADATGYKLQNDGREPKQQILDYLHEKSLLLILDNFEHLIPGASIVTDIIHASPHIKVLVTSRQRLNQSGETLFHLGGMDFPNWKSPEDALEYSAVKLFMQSAKRVRPDFELVDEALKYVADICRLAQGMPLGILLAASWLELLSVQEIAEEMSKNIDFLQTELSDFPERQRSMRAVFNYSWDLLNAEEKDIFMKLSLFRGGFMWQAAQSVAGAGLRNLMALVNKSLIRRHADSGRYEVHELLRQFAEEHLKASDLYDKIRDNHMHHYLQLIAERETMMKERRQKAAFAELDTEFDNIRMALSRVTKHQDYASLATAAEALYHYGDTHMRYHAILPYFETLFQHLITLQDWDEHQQTVAVTYLRLYLIQVVMVTQNYASFLEQLHKVTAQVDVNGSRKNRILCLYLQARHDYYVTEYLQSLSNYKPVRDYYLQEGDKFSAAVVNYHVGYAYYRLGQIARTVEHMRESVAWMREIGVQISLGRTLIALGSAELAQGDYAKSTAYMRESKNMFEAGDEPFGIAHTGSALSFREWLHGNSTIARALAIEAINIGRYINAPFVIGYASTLLLLIDLLDAQLADIPARFEQIEKQVKDESLLILVELAKVVWGYHQQDEKAMRTYLAQIIKSSSVSRDKIDMLICLPIAALLESKAGKYAHATELLSVAWRHPEEIVGWMKGWSIIKALHEELKQHLGEAGYSVAWTKGKSADLEMTVLDLVDLFTDDE